MKKSTKIIMVILTIVVLLSIGSTAFARDIARIDKTVGTGGWEGSTWMYKQNSHNVPAVMFIESTPIKLQGTLYNTATEACVGYQNFDRRERRECYWTYDHGQPGYRYFASLVSRTGSGYVTSSHCPDAY